MIQGWTLDQYIGCVDSMRERGLLTDYLGVGSVCVRKRVREAMGIARALREALPARTRLHYFGLKIEALRQPGFAQLAESIDTGAWALYGKFYAAWGGDGLCEYCGKERTYEAGTRGDVGHLHRFPRSDQRLDRFYRYVRVLAETPQTALERFGEAR